MRIVAGTLKNRKIKSREGKETRPTLERIKEAIFSIIGDKITDDLEVLSAIQVFFNGNTLFNTITDKNYEKSDNKLTFTRKIKLSDIGNKFYLNPGAFTSEETGNLSEMTLTFAATIDTTTNEILGITLDLKSFIEGVAKAQLEKEKDSMSELEYTTAKNRIYFKRLTRRNHNH